ncbi:MAG: hypothetical protein JY451_02935 [Erythrobacter sp.]|nr:MAG: hypothetical protein JY451_02935 [Erythrobacter sp.]
MPEMMQDNLLYILIALVIAVLLAFWLFHATRRTRVEREDRQDDVSARRNQALIDAAPAARKDDLDKRASANLVHSTEDQETMASAASPGPVSGSANTQGVAAATAGADAEAGAAIPAREAMHEVPQEVAVSGTDDLSRIKGVGPKLVAILHDQGVTSFAQIAAWDDAAIDRIDARLGRFEGRIRRDDWVEQARLLAAEDLTGYEARFGKV